MQQPTLALDLEGTLISNAMSCFPRPGLHAFLDRMQPLFSRIVLFTAVPEARVRPILLGLAEDGDLPAWFARVPQVEWHGDFKDLTFIPHADVARTLLVDDWEPYIHPEQREQWVPIDAFSAPYPDSDRELVRVADVLARRREQMRV